MGDVIDLPSFNLSSLADPESLNDSLISLRGYPTRATLSSGLFGRPSLRKSNNDYVGMDGTIARVETTDDRKSGVIQYKNLNTEGGHSGSPLLLLRDSQEGNIVLDGESGSLIDRRILNNHGYATKLDEMEYDIIGVHI